MKIKEITKTTASQLRVAMQEALKQVEDKHNVTIVVKGGSFLPTDITFKVAISVQDEDGEAITREATVFKEFATRYGLQPTDLGKTFVSRGETFTIIGLNTRARKMPILAQNSKGKKYKFSGEMAGILLKQ